MEYVGASQEAVEGALKDHFRDSDLRFISMKDSRLAVERALKIKIPSTSRPWLKQLVVRVANAEQARRDARGSPHPKVPADSAVLAATTSSPPSPASPSFAQPELSYEEALSIARKRKFKQLSPALSAVCGGRKAASHKLIIRYIWEYIHGAGLLTREKTVKLDPALRAAFHGSVDESTLEISTKTIPGAFKHSVTPFHGEPPDEEVRHLMLHPPKSSVGGSKRSREGASQAAGMGLPEDFKELKKPRQYKVYRMSPALQAVVPPHRVGEVPLTTRQHAMKWIWEYVRAENLFENGGFKPTPKLTAVLGSPRPDGYIPRLAIAKALSGHLTPYDGPPPAWLAAEKAAKLEAYEQQQQQLKDLGLKRQDIRQLSGKAPKAAKPRRSAASGLFVLDDALQQVVKLRIASVEVLCKALELHARSICGATDPLRAPFKPDPALCKVTGSSAPVTVGGLETALAGHMTPVPADLTHAMVSGIMDNEGFQGVPLREHIQRCLQSDVHSSHSTHLR